MEIFLLYVKKLTEMAIIVFLMICVYFGFFYLEGFYIYQICFTMLAIFIIACKFLLMYTEKIYLFCKSKKQEKLAREALELAEEQEFEKIMLQLKAVSDEELKRAYERGKIDGALEIVSKFISKSSNN